MCDYSLVSFGSFGCKSYTHTHTHTDTRTHIDTHAAVWATAALFWNLPSVEICHCQTFFQDMYYLCAQKMVCLYTTGSGSQGGSTNPTAPTGTRKWVHSDSGMTPANCIVTPCIKSLWELPTLSCNPNKVHWRHQIYSAPIFYYRGNVAGACLSTAACSLDKTHKRWGAATTQHKYRQGSDYQTNSRALLSDL